MNELDLFGESVGPVDINGRQLRDEGIARVLGNNTFWLEKCRLYATQFVKARPATTFTGEDIRLYCEIRGLNPTSYKAWGGLTSSLIKSGLIVKTGEWVQAKIKTSHARPIQVYRSGLTIEK